jgi:hypothetical protein
MVSLSNHGDRSAVAPPHERARYRAATALTSGQERFSR